MPKKAKVKITSEEQKIKGLLKGLKDPETGVGLLDSGMIKDIKIQGKTVSVKLVPASIGCAGCGLVQMMAADIENVLKKHGYKAKIEIGF